MKEIAKAPLCFEPYMKSVIWGGNKICQYKGIKQDIEKIGESWEISAVPGHVSVVAEGEYAGKNLTDLIEEYGKSLLGEKVIEQYGKNFPLLVKIIDANDNLSVQVHPDDELARKRHNSLGKTEMWYIISAEDDAKIYAGLNRKITPDVYERMVADGTFSDVLATHDSNAGDVFFLPAGRVHAIGAGNLLAEIQESSDITYRIFDYNRRDAAGNTRELHTELAKDAVDYTVYDNYKSAAPSADVKDAEIVKCSHFNVHRVLVDGIEQMSLRGDSFAVVMCIEGEVALLCENGVAKLSAGNTALLPASVGAVTVEGTGSLIISQV